MRKWMKCLVTMALAVLLSTILAACVAPVPVTEPPSAPIEPNTIISGEEIEMVHQKVQLTSKQADGYIIPLGKVNIVCVITDVGMVGCGAFDVVALDPFSIPAVRVKSTTGNPIATIDDLLNGMVKEANAEAAKLGINIGMSGGEALDLL
jgi:uncharacterized protein YunC (DUF1805 family)